MTNHENCPILIANISAWIFLSVQCMNASAFFSRDYSYSYMELHSWNLLYKDITHCAINQYRPQRTHHIPQQTKNTLKKSQEQTPQIPNRAQHDLKKKLQIEKLWSFVFLIFILSNCVHLWRILVGKKSYHSANLKESRHVRKCSAILSVNHFM